MQAIFQTTPAVYGAEESEFHKITNEKIKEANAEVVFGAPSKNCSGSGICLVVGRQHLKNMKIRCASYSAKISFHANETLYFEFEKSTLLDGSIGCHQLFYSHFLVEESFSIPLHISSKLGFRRRLWVLPGSYPIVDGFHSKKIILKVM